MNDRARLALLLLALTSLACGDAHAGTRGLPPPDGVPPGTTLHYVRSNADGSESEHVFVFRRDARALEVYKMRERCTSAALVTATLAPDGRQATSLSAGRLLPEARRREIGTLLYDAGRQSLTMNLHADGRSVVETVHVPAEPWHLYDFDLATLAVALPARSDRRGPLAFTLALVWPEPAPGEPMLRVLGRVEATFEREDVHGGRAALRFVAGGPGLGDGGGPLWIDAESGVLLGVDWRLPNHPGYSNFRLELVERVHDSATGWAKRLRDHFEGCAASGTAYASRALRRSPACRDPATLAGD